jgi:hypothetical protein
MKKSIPTFAAAFLITAIATPVFAQAAIQEPGAYSFYHPNADVLNGRQSYRTFDQPNALTNSNAYYNEVTPARESQIAPRRHRKAHR